MIVSARHGYAYPLERVYAAFTSADFYRDKFAAVGARNVNIVDEQRSQDGYRIVVEREVPLEVPAVLRSFLGDWNSIRQQETWDDLGDEYANEIQITAVGVPVDLRGSMILRADGDSSCVNDVEMEISCSVPLVGGKLTEFVARNTEKGLADEFAAITDWLSRHG
jgi:hypothetical protein